MTKPALNLIGPQVKKWRIKNGWSQEDLAARLQLRGWSISRDSVANLESQRRRVPDCEILFLSRVLEVELEDLFPKGVSLSKLGPAFQSGEKLGVYPTRSDK